MLLTINSTNAAPQLLVICNLPTLLEFGDGCGCCRPKNLPSGHGSVVDRIKVQGA